MKERLRFVLAALLLAAVLTGQKVLVAQRHSWREFVEAINRITGIEHA